MFFACFCCFFHDFHMRLKCQKLHGVKCTYVVYSRHYAYTADCMHIHVCTYTLPTSCDPSSLMWSQVLDARDPLGTRSRRIESYLKKEKPHKHLILLLNKCDLVPTWVTVRGTLLLLPPLLYFTPPPLTPLPLPLSPSL